MWHDHMWNGPWMMGWGVIPMLFFWLLLIVAIFYLIKTILSSSKGDAGDASLQILKERLASGDISQDEFERLYKKLKQAH